MNHDNKAYVYVVLIDGVARYIGKGRGRRMAQHVSTAKRILAKRECGQSVRTTHFYNRLAQSLSKNKTVDVRVLASGLTDEEAFDLERAEIARAPAGALWNKLEGGNGLSSSEARKLNADPGRRAAQSLFMKERWKSPDYLRARERWLEEARQTPEFFEMRSSASKARWSRPGAGSRHGDAMREKFKQDPQRRAERSNHFKALWADPAIREKFMARENNPEYRANRSRAVAEANKRRAGRIVSEKTREKLRNASLADWERKRNLLMVPR